MKHTTLLTVCLMAATATMAQEPPSIEYFSDNINHWRMTHPADSYERWDVNEYTHIADNIVAYQNADGGWMKNIDWLARLNPDSVVATLKPRHRLSTIDNRNVVPQVEYLADVYTRTGYEKYRTAAERGIDYILDTQKKNGGWRGWDADAITFNDDVTTNVIAFLYRVVQGDERFAWLRHNTRKRIEQAYERGIAVVLRCQVEQNGVKTVWAQQYDNETYEPVKARSYELPALSAPESCNILMMLMAIENPGEELRDAITAAVKWMWQNRIVGKRLQWIEAGTDSITGKPVRDRIVVDDPEARPMWPRYCELDDNTPFFCTRAGVKVSTFDQVERERRTGYAWYSTQPNKVLRRYPKWAKQWGVPFDGFDKM